MARIAITTEEMKDEVESAMKLCFERHPEKYVRSFGLRYEWVFGKINGRTLLRILQEEYGWEGIIPLVRQMSHGEKILASTQRAKDNYSKIIHDAYA